MQYSVNGSSSDSSIYQRVSGTTPGAEYAFSAWVMTAPRENSTWKYDVWNDQGRLIYMRLGIDPTGGTNAAAASVQWTPRMYSHRHYSNLAKTAVAKSTNLTVFISMKGTGVEWHLYGVDDCVLSREEIPTRFRETRVTGDGLLQTTITSKANRTNRIEASTKAFGADLLVTDDVISRVDGEFILDYAGTAEVKGRSDALKMYKVRGYVENGQNVEIKTPYSDYEAEGADKVKIKEAA